jgi:hypothetical protein
MSDKVFVSAEDLNRMIGMAMPHRDRLVDELTKASPGRAAYALGIALAGLFASLMTSDPDQQADQAALLNEILRRWDGIMGNIPWRLVPEQ